MVCPDQRMDADRQLEPNADPRDDGVHEAQMITPKGYWEGQSFDVAALTLPTSEIAAPHTAPKMLLWSLLEPILALQSRAGRVRRDVLAARALLAEIVMIEAVGSSPDWSVPVLTFVAVDAETKLVPSFRIGKRDLPTATAFMNDLAGRLSNRVQLSSDALAAYVEAVEAAFGADVDYG